MNITKDAPVAGRRAITRDLAGWVSRLRPDDIPDATFASAKLCLLDAIGCGLFGSQLPWGQMSADAAVELSPGGTASLWGSHRTTGPAAAAMANGTAVHGFELDDIHLRSVFHPGATVIPAVLAVAETRYLSGRQVLTATVAGYEAGIRVGNAAGVGQALRGFHQTGTVGCIASASGVAHLLELDQERATNAIGIGATQASGLYCARMGAMAKRFHAGHAAQAGVTAGLLAERGFTGSPDAIEAPVGGFMSTLGENADLDEVMAGLGRVWETDSVGFKAYAACASAHTIIDGLDVLMKDGLGPDNLEHLTIEMSKISVNNVGWTYRPADIVAAQMNGFYAAAVKLIDGEAFVDQYREERLADPRILALIERITIRHDPELDRGGAQKRHASRIEARRTDGETMSVFTEQRRGSAERPLTVDEVVTKFRRTARTALDEQDVLSLEGVILNIETLASLEPLSRFLRRREKQT